MARRSNQNQAGKSEPPDGTPQIRGARHEPIRFVERELIRPDGTACRVEVPVYPPFRLEEKPARKAAAGKPDPEEKD